MESIIERITRGNFWDFHGGIHPPEQKTLTSTKAIKTLPLPKQLILPLQQHIGLEGSLLVEVGDKVLKGQPLTSSDNPMTVPIHASTSGMVTAIKKSVIAHPSGLSELCIFIDVDGSDTWIERQKCEDITLLSKSELIEKIADSGIAGMGGAGFPTHIKVNNQSKINFLILNGAECEPYITADDLLMQEHAKAIVSGIKIIEKLLEPTHILIAIENNKPQAIEAMQQATKEFVHIKVCTIPTKYPIGGEKQLIQILTGQEVKSGSLPIQAGIVMQNIATCFAINDAVVNGTPLLQRVVTVTGQALTNPQNVWALLGTPINFLLSECGAQPQKNSAQQDQQAIIMGGPMMGYSLANDFVPVIKTSNCILVPSKQEMPSAFTDKSEEVECIRCGQCSDVCPSQLLPQELQWSAKAKDHPQLTKLNLSDCIECGACAYVCPSQIPLVQYYRVAKAEIRSQQQSELKADKAKLRFEARKLRLEQEKIAREQKHKKAAEARKAAMNKNTPEAVGAKSAVAAALARVKAKKANSQLKNSSTNTQEPTNEPSESMPVDGEKDQVKAAIARAKAKRLAKIQERQQVEEPKITGLDVVASDKVKQPLPTQEKPEVLSQAIDSKESIKPADDKKAKVAAAIAKAKAKKLALAIEKNNDSNTLDQETAKESVNKTSNTEKNTSEDIKKAKVALAIAKAKKRKQEQVNSSTNPKNEST